MDDTIRFDYYYGLEAEQFSFYRVPRLLIKDARFKKLSSDAKLLYGLMLDRMSLSMKNGWVDDENRAYIYYTLDNIMEDLGCAKEKCARILAELDEKKGIGLIRKKRQGLGKPDIIYVMNFASISPEKRSDNVTSTDASTEVRKSNFKKFENRTSGSSETEPQEVRKPNLWKFENRTSKSSETEPLEVRKPNPNYNNISYNNQSYTDMSPINPIYLSEGDSTPEQDDDRIDRTDRIDAMDTVSAYRDLIRENLNYDFHMQYDSEEDKRLLKEIYEIICDVVCIPRKTVRIEGQDYPYELVRSRFLKLTSSHVDYVRWRMRETTTKIKNIRSYLRTTLYNAPTTLNHFYQQEVQHDMYGGGWEDRTGPGDSEGIQM